MSNLSKMGLLLRSLRSSPTEFCDRVGTAWEVRRDRMRRISRSYQTVSLQTAIPIIEEALGRQVQPFLTEIALSALEDEMKIGRSVLDSKAPFSIKHNGDTQLARFCYVVARALTPQITLETGVAYGVTSAHLLQALQCNESGDLWSVDLPPLGKDADQYVGFLIPLHLRNRWQLHRGPTKRILPALLPSLPKLDMFVQDSLHTYRTITEELTIAWRFLRHGGVVIVDDIGENSAFQDFAHSADHSACVVVKENDKDSAFGVLVKR